MLSSGYHFISDIILLIAYIAQASAGIKVSASGPGATADGLGFMARKSHFPVVMGRCSHWFRDGDAQDGLRRMLPDLDERGLSYADGLELMQRMFRAAR
ncbi:MAG: hypothetical protein OXC05_08265 [Halieaceae bacterium]|nr:hypothetical protein [Halieaceae bacterium]